ncbi:CDP-glycerol glycerophosphotransferase family protein [Vagococcus bubulae]|uniref:CDP-glycerol--poly(Glycerophosphate) glycerophosphotransferase n=1 Tax=Vagococcus bubulae TaxID=1977868 RepID=A0A429ZM66_9ENTE|nr:CDP-glycerol glycerophosphotransferase family protein [Vagococcus bubulae]RST94794.1 hypothetical protein CBF36_04500 [Vagococcus bubulae]
MKHLLVSFLKERYSWFIRQLSKKNQHCDVLKQVCYLMSFPNNNHGLIEALKNEYDVVVLYTKSCEEEARYLQNIGVSIYCLDTMSGLVRGVRQLSQSKVVIADNYFACLGDISFKETQTVYQLWHATGAIKQFGLEDKTAMKRSKKDKERFRRVYDAFDYVFVASERMGDVFKRSYGFSDEQILLTGFARTDYLVNQMEQTQQTDKRHILYLPTYRENSSLENWLLDIEYLSGQLSQQDLLQVKLHPHVTMTQKFAAKNVEWIVSTQSADDYIKQADVLITDYSSVAFDFTLANPEKQLIMYWPDEMIYNKTTGIQQAIKQDFPQPVAYTTLEILNQLNDTQKIDNQKFNQLWNTYNDGKATSRVVREIKEVMDGEK